MYKLGFNSQKSIKTNIVLSEKEKNTHKNWRWQEKEAHPGANTASRTFTKQRRKRWRLSPDSSKASTNTIHSFLKEGTTFLFPVLASSQSISLGSQQMWKKSHWSSTTKIFLRLWNDLLIYQIIYHDLHGIEKVSICGTISNDDNQFSA